MKKTAVEVRGLVKRYGDIVAVGGVSFEISEGEIFGLIGPNGAGKTTTIQVMTTLVPPTSGRVLVGGLDVVREGFRVRSMLGYVPQALSADGSLTGYENLLVFAKLLGLPREERKKRVEMALRRMRLEDAAGRLVKQYSGGMVRRLEIGQAILHQPRLLVLDEPTIGLDPTARRSVWEVIEELRKASRMTVLVTTHYMEEAEANCERVAIMNHGRIAAIGTPEELERGVGRPDGTLEDVFTALTRDQAESGGSYRETRQLRRRIRRFG